MTALSVALTFGLTTFLSGVGWSRHRNGDGTGVALASTTCLAALFVATTNIASVWGFSVWAFLATAVAILAGGWVIRIRRQSSWSWLQQFSPNVALVMAVTALSLAIPLIVLPVPLDTDAQGFGYLALMIRDGGSLTSLAPWHPEISYLYPPGALLLFAALSKLAPQVAMSSIMMGASHAAAFLFVCLSWEFGNELGLQDARLGRPGAGTPEALRRWSWAAALSAALSVGLWTALLDSHFTAIFGLLFALGCLTSLFRYQRTGRPIDAAISALSLSAVVLSHPDMAVALGFGLAALLLARWLAFDGPRISRWLVIGLAVPGGAFVLVTPWLVRVWPLAQSALRSPFVIDPYYLRVLVLYHGVGGPVLALVGAVVFLRRRSMWAIAMAGWILATIDLSSVGLLERIYPWLGASILRFDYPFSLAWHAPIIPYMALTAGAWVTLTEKIRLQAITRWVPRLAAASAGILTVAVVFRGPLLELSQGRLNIYGAFATSNDIAAMRWLHGHTAPEARVLNYPGDYEAGRDWEGHWAPVISERDAVYFRRQPFFLFPDGQAASDGAYHEQSAFLAFWHDPADAANASVLRRAGIEYVLVPEAIGDPASVRLSWRWRSPALFPGGRSVPADAPYLELVFKTGGAEVYRLPP